VRTKRLLISISEKDNEDVSYIYTANVCVNGVSWNRRNYARQAVDGLFGRRIPVFTNSNLSNIDVRILLTPRSHHENS
jgi:hypothetical protein